MCLKSSNRPNRVFLLRWLGPLSHLHPQVGRPLREEEDLPVFDGSLAPYLLGPLPLHRPDPDNRPDVHLRPRGCRPMFHQLPLPHGAPPDLTPPGPRGHHPARE